MPPKSKAGTQSKQEPQQPQDAAGTSVHTPSVKEVNPATPPPPSQKISRSE
mgnify:CR=1 FL=1